MPPTKRTIHAEQQQHREERGGCAIGTATATGRTRVVVAMLSVLVLLSLATGTAAFATTRTNTNAENARQSRISGSLSAMPGGNNNDNNDNDNDNDIEWSPNDLFESIKNFFQPKDKNDKSNTNTNANDISSASTSQFFRAGSGNNYVDDDDDDDDDDLPAGTTLLLRIPAKQLKPGGLRLFLMFYLMGMQNTPDPNTWRADQKLMSVNVAPKTLPNGMTIEQDDEKKYVLEMLYDMDRSGMLQIELLPHENRPSKQPEIRIYRCGSRPSTSYLMQESLIVDGVLDELQNLSGGANSNENDNENVDEPEIAEEDRLLIPDPESAIVEARDSLAFG